MEEPTAVVPEPGETLDIISRADWNAVGPPDGRMMLAASVLLFGHTKSYVERLRRNVHNFDCNTTDSNKEKMRAMQDFDSRYFGDIRYSFLIGGDGKIYEGRGWNKSPAVPKKFHSLEDRSLFIAMLEPLPDRSGVQEMLNARNKLIKEGISRGFIKANCLEVTVGNKLFWSHFRSFLSRI
ncbi:peptidoglycan recognition protein 1-like [Macrosteles quadrilineatus]|uniref:peptidoglycan recognition protein 1-like n=1 Tax=Macrosteles quadrilineatus TaxID=74068 RepID=UPI0023E10584|nr:peptidoglycan recognition protein 1-like [Macrosteles quadrilineatus]